MSRDAAVALSQVTAVAVAIMVLALLIVVWARPRGSAARGTASLGGYGKDWAEIFDGRLALVEERQKNVEHDVKNIRAALPALPSKEAVHRLEVQVAELKGQIGTVESMASLTARAIDRIENFLLNESGQT